MFDLEQSIADWRRQMLAAGIKTPVPLEELEIHLREEMEQQVKSGANRQQAFEMSVAQMGQAEPLKMEFKKIDAENWNRPLAWAAWGLFTTSFFLPACKFIFGPLWGWECAWLSVESVIGTGATDLGGQNHLGRIHLGLQTLANLLMIASPFWLLRYSQNARAMKWLRGFGRAALALVWSYVLFLLAVGDGQDLEVGCYVWAASFLLLYLSTLKMRSRNALVPKYA